MDESETAPGPGTRPLLSVHCDTCKWWIKEPENSYRAVPELGQCKRAVELWKAMEWVNEDEWDLCKREIKKEHSGVMLFCQDGSDYSASVWTKGKFFCAHWEQREEKERILPEEKKNILIIKKGPSKNAPRKQNPPI